MTPEDLASVLAEHLNNPVTIARYDSLVAFLDSISISLQAIKTYFFLLVVLICVYWLIRIMWSFLDNFI